MKAHNLVQMLSQTVNRFPDKPACLWKENGQFHSMTYQKLWHIIRDFAFGLERLGIRAGSKVALLARNHPRWLISDFAILSLGAVTVPIHPSSSTDQIRHLLEHAGAEAIIVGDPDLLAQLPQPLSSKTRHVILMTQEAGEGHKALQFETVLQMGQTVALEELDWAYPAIQPAELATIVYTHASDAPSKGIMLSHANLISSIESASLAVPISQHDRLLSVLPLSHILERTAGQYSPLFHGATIAYANYAEPLDAQQLMQELKDFQPTILIGMPSLFEQMHDMIQQKIQSSWIRQMIFSQALHIAQQHQLYAQKGWNWPVPAKWRFLHACAHGLAFAPIHRAFGGKLRFMISDGSSFPSAITRFFRLIGIPIVESCSLAECSLGISLQRIPDLKPGTAGKPLPGMEIRILSDGELLVKSSSVMMGYYRDVEATSKVLVNGWLHTGLLVEVDDGGWIRIKERKIAEEMAIS